VLPTDFTTRSCFPCRTLTKLDLSWNAFGRPEALKALALALSGKEREREGRHGHGEQASISRTGKAAPEAALIELDLSSNGVDNHGAFLLAGALETNRCLQHLRLDRNCLEKSGAHAILTAAVRTDHSVIVSMAECGIGQKHGAQRVFDPCEPAGAYRIDLSKKISLHILKSLVRLVKQGFGMFMPLPPMTLDAKPQRLHVARATCNVPHYMLLRRNVTKPSSPEVDEKDINKILAALPNKGILEFTYGGMRKLPVVGQPLAEPLFQMLLTELKHGRTLSVQAISDILTPALHGHNPVNPKCEV